MFETKEEAASYLNGLFQGKSIGFGDSKTLVQLGLYASLRQNNTVIDPAQFHDHDSFNAAAREALATEYFFTSVNALTEDGVMVNLDGTGNRIAGSLFGHKKVFFVVGRNKIMPTLDEAIDRVRNVAAPLNAQRIGLPNPCVVHGDRCYDCSSQRRICNALVVHLKKMNDMDMEVVLINQDLGL